MPRKNRNGLERRKNMISNEQQKYKNQILEWLDHNEKKFIDYEWIYFSNKFGLREIYLPDAYKSLKCWYQENKKKEKSQQYKNLLSVESSSFESFIDYQSGEINLTVEGRKTKTILQWIIDFFKIIKTFTASISDKAITRYYELFFENFQLQMFSKISLLPEAETNFWSSNFKNNVKDSFTMIEYLQKLPGLYAKLCLWCAQNPFPKTTSTVIHDHHVMPQFLVEHYGFLSENINVSYNLIKVDWLMHFILHLIRLIEWGQPEDDRAIQVLTGLKKSKKTRRFNSNERILSLCSVFYTICKKSIFKNYESFVKKQIQVSAKGGQATARLRFRLNIKQILGFKTVWQHESYYNSKGNLLTVTMDAQNNQEFSAKQYLRELLLALPEKDQNREYYLNNSISAHDCFRYFLKSKNSQKQLFGFKQLCFL